MAHKLYGYEAEFAPDGTEIIARLTKRRHEFDILLLDTLAPPRDSFATLREMRSLHPRLPVIMVGPPFPDDVVLALRAGAIDFLPKPVTHEDLHNAIERSLNFAGSRSSHKTRMASAPIGNGAFSPLLEGWSRKVELLLSQMSGSDIPLLLRGETGVGKEVLARQFHARSSRSRHPFLKLNCAALPSELVESELFGYERGAFTGALTSRPGKFELASGGTILLDEIGDMDFKLQAKLLQVLQDKEFMRLGATEISRIDVRIMAATHCDLEQAIAQGTFREDLFYRLNIIEIHIPPLRERRDEILGLAEFLLRKHAPDEGSPEIPWVLRQALLEHTWPGNLRELENVMRKLIVLRNPGDLAGDLLSKSRKKKPLALSSTLEPALELARLQSVPRGPFVTPPALSRDAEPMLENLESCTDNLRANILGDRAAPTSPLARVREARKVAETEAIVAALSSTYWNRKRAASLLQMEYKALLYKMKKLGIGTKSAKGPQPTMGGVRRAESSSVVQVCA